jgi:hypothetical protein
MENDLYNRFDISAMGSAGISIPTNDIGSIQFEINYRHSLNDMFQDNITDIRIKSNGIGAGDKLYNAILKRFILSVQIDHQMHRETGAFFLEFEKVRVRAGLKTMEELPLRLPVCSGYSSTK